MGVSSRVRKKQRQLGFKVGDPIFKFKEAVRQHNVIVRSSNFVLYGDMSRRVMQTIRLFSPDVEVYSIDEAFIQLDGLAGSDNLSKKCVECEATILQWTGHSRFDWHWQNKNTRETCKSLRQETY